MSAIIGGTRVWTYVAQGVVPPNMPEHQIEAIVRASVSWSDTMLGFIKGSDVKVETLSADELARRTSGISLAQ